MSCHPNPCPCREPLTCDDHVATPAGDAARLNATYKGPASRPGWSLVMQYGGSFLEIETSRLRKVCPCPPPCPEPPKPCCEGCCRMAERVCRLEEEVNTLRGMRGV